MEAHALVKSASKAATGWWTVEIEGHPKLSTKKDDIGQAAQGLLGQIALVRWTEKPSKNLNPNTNEPYTDRWLDSVLPARADAPAPAAPQAALTPQPAPTPPQPAAAPAPAVAQAGAAASRDESIIRQVAWKCAAQLGSDFNQARHLAHLIAQDITAGDWTHPDDDIPF